VHTGFWWGNLRERPVGRPRRRWEDNIEIDFKEVELGGTKWIDQARDRDRWRAVVEEGVY
jgi:hypothetical protein